MANALCPSHGTKTGTSCVFTRKLCMTCTESGSVVTIRAQSNNMPSHCFYSPGDTPVEVEVDYSATWLPATSGTVAANDVSTQDDVDSLICNILRSADSNIPSASNYVLNSGTAQNTAWGIAVTGMLMFSAASAEGVDPFYPAVYGTVTDASSVVEVVDSCSCHP